MAHEILLKRLQNQPNASSMAIYQQSNSVKNDSLQKKHELECNVTMMCHSPHLTTVPFVYLIYLNFFSVHIYHHLVMSPRSLWGDRHPRMQCCLIYLLAFVTGTLKKNTISCKLVFCFRRKTHLFTLGGTIWFQFN